MSDADVIEIFKVSGAAAGTIIVFLVGRFEYRKSIKIRRAEFLDKLIAEFQDKKTSIARGLLDDYVYVTDKMKELTPSQQKEVAESLSKYLRDHHEHPIENDDEIKVRKSFDALFDFFTKLSYYLRNKLITPKELTYFRYYLNKLVLKKDEVNEYINTYFYKKDIDILLAALKKLDR